MSTFPAFMCRPENAVQLSREAGGLEGYLFEGADGSQMVLWQSTQGGDSPLHTHDFDEYSVVVEGTFTGTIGDQQVTLGPGEECFIPAGVPHSGRYSAPYRAIDAFGGRRVKRAKP